MKRIALGSLVLALASGLAWAAAGSPAAGMINADEPSPCQDGWAGCIVGGKELSHEPVTDSAGRPMPASLRVSWFDLAAGPAFSPFQPLSEYSGELPANATSTDAVVDADPVEADPEVDPVEEPSGQDQDTAAPDPEPVVAELDPEPVADPDPYEPEPEPYVEPVRSDPDPRPSYGSRADPDPDPEPSGSSLNGSRASADPDPEPAVQGSRASSDPEPKDEPPEDPNAGRSIEPDPEPDPEPIITEIAPEPPKMDLGCDNLVTLEPAALMGKLNEGQRSCLEERIRNTGTITQKDKISRVLLINAEASGSKKEWERLAKRHLEDIDRSDPNLCFKYAQHLSRGGVGRAWGVIKWADYALENKSQWSGTTYKTRVYALYQLKSEAAMKLWEDANKKLVDAGADREEWAGKEEKYRGMAKDYSREWLDYARASNQDTKKPMSLCVSAAGSKKFCQD